MNLKQVLGLLVFCIGLGLFYYGSYSRTHLSGARSEIHKMAQSKNPIIQSVGREMEKKVGNVSAKVKWEFAGGAVLILGGAAVVFFCRDKKKGK